MSTEIECVNMALVRVGADVITSLDQPVPRAAICKVFVAPGRRAFLESAYWGFARAVSTLAAVSGQPVDPDYSLRYPLPPNFLKLWALAGDNADYPVRRDGAYLLTDAGSPISVIYTRDVPEIGRWPEKAATAYAWALAASICMKISGNRQLTNEIADEARALLNDARHSESMQDPPTGLETVGWLESRRQGQ